MDNNQQSEWAIEFDESYGVLFYGDQKIYDDVKNFISQKKLEWEKAERERVIQALKIKKIKFKCSAGHLCDGDMCCGGQTDVVDGYNQAVVEVEEKIAKLNEADSLS